MIKLERAAAYRLKFKHRLEQDYDSQIRDLLFKEFPISLFESISPLMGVIIIPEGMGGKSAEEWFKNHDMTPEPLTVYVR